VIGGRVFDLMPDLRDAGLDVGLLAGAVDDRGVVLGDGHAFGAAQHLHRHVLELDVEVLGDHLTARQQGDVLQHRLAAVAEAWGLDGGHLQAAAQLVVRSGSGFWPGSRKRPI
jgi:hypothetical protein